MQKKRPSNITLRRNVKTKNKTPPCEQKRKEGKRKGKILKYN
jgi:hypothetical protein